MAASTSSSRVCSRARSWSSASVSMNVGWWKRPAPSSGLERGSAALVAVSEDARQLRRFALLGREGVRLLLLAELEPMLDGPEEHVRVGEPSDVAPFDITSRGELRECHERRGRPYLRIVA